MIVFWGDSVFDGPEGNGYVPAMVADLLDHHIVPSARAGMTSRELVEHIGLNPELHHGTAIISSGRCNYDWGADKVARDLERAVALLGHDDWFFVSVPRSKYAGTVSHELCRAIDEAIIAFAGDRFLDVQQHLIDHGLRLAGIAPTERDKRDIAGGIIPASLRCDPIHCNHAGNIVSAQFIAAHLVDRGIAVPRQARAAA